MNGIINVDKNYFPGWVRKAITFSNDDGNLTMDRKFIDILKPCGIKGTFNLCDIKPELSEDGYREMYSGFGIANHCRLHPFAFDDNREYTISSDPFDPEGANPNYIYHSAEHEGVFWVAKAPFVWRLLVSGEDYVRLIGETQAKLDKVFGKGKAVSFVWPFTEQNNKVVKDYLKENFRSVRCVGTLRDTTNFSMPEDRTRWSYNATHTDLLEVAELFETAVDDGSLKFFCFGLHSIDYEYAKKWDDLKAFAKKYGNRTEKFYYATVDEIFDYEDALNKLIINEKTVKNPTEITLFIKVNGERIKLAPKGAYSV